MPSETPVRVEVNAKLAEQAAREAGATPILPPCRTSDAPHEYKARDSVRCANCGSIRPSYRKFHDHGPEFSVLAILKRGKNAQWLTAGEILRRSGNFNTPNGMYVAALRLAALGDIKAKRNDNGTIVFQRNNP